MMHLQDPAVAEAAAAKAAAQLLAEEDQAASKVAAKKAKKLRQKLAKKQQAQSDAAESTSANVLSTEDAVEAEAAAPQSPGQLAAQSEAASLPHPVADSQPPPMQPPVPSSSQDTTPELHAAPQQSTVLAQPAPSVPMLDQSGGLAMHGSEQAAAQPPGPPGQQPDPDACFLHSLFCCPITQVGHQAFQSAVCTCRLDQHQSW